MVEDHANSIWLTGKIFHLQYMTNSCMQMLAFVGLGLYCFMITRLNWGALRLPDQRLPGLPGSWHRAAVTEGQPPAGERLCCCGDILFIL